MRRLYCCVVLVAAALPAADTSLLRYAAADTNFILGVNFRAVMKTPAGRAALAQAQNSAELVKFIAETGFDPLRDIDEIVIAGAANLGKNSGSLLMRGRFSAAALERLSTQQFTATEYHGVRIFTRAAEEPASVALLSPTLLIAGDPERVRQAIRRGPAAGLPSELAARAAELSSMHLWFAAIVPPSALADAELPQGINAELARSIQQVSGGVNFEDDVVFAAELLASTPKDAESIATLARMFAGLAASSQGDAKQAGALLEKLTIKTEGPTVRLGLIIPQEEVMRWAQQIRDQVAAARKPATEPPPPAPTGVTIYSSPEDMGVVTLPPPK